MVHKELVKINKRLSSRLPLFSPSIAPTIKKIDSESAVAKLTKAEIKRDYQGNPQYSLYLLSKGSQLWSGPRPTDPKVNLQRVKNLESHHQ